MSWFSKLLPGRAPTSGGDNPATKRKSFTFYSGYDATKPKNRRAAPTGIVRSEDAELPPTSRRQLVSGVRDIHRNFSVVGWAVRRHLDYVSTFTFRSKTGIDALDGVINTLIAAASRRENFDIAQRHSLARALRMSEARRLIDGDILWLKLGSGQTQIIEGDRIRTPYAGIPTGINPMWINQGVYCNAAGRPIAYVLCRRARTTDTGIMGMDMIYDRMLQAQYVYHHACWDTTARFDQVRGISPIASAYNSFRDVYENIDYASVKAKIAQMFGVAITRNGSPEETGLGVGGTGVYDGTTEGGPPSCEPDERYKGLDFGRGPVVLQLDQGDDAKIIESQTPSTQFQDFIPLVLQIALKSLDIPYSFADESHTNYSGQRQAWILYEKSARSKRIENHDLLDDWTRWRLQIMVDDGELELPKGMTVADLKWQWKATGTPWVDPLKEALADVAAMEAGLESPIGVADRIGDRDPHEILQETADWLADRRNLGLPDPPWITPKPTGGTGTTAAAAAADAQKQADQQDDSDAKSTAGNARRAAAAHLASLPAEPEKVNA
jgi:capsid protein